MSFLLPLIPNCRHRGFQAVEISLDSRASDKKDDWMAKGNKYPEAKSAKRSNDRKLIRFNSPTRASQFSNYLGSDCLRSTVPHNCQRLRDLGSVSLPTSRSLHSVHECNHSSHAWKSSLASSITFGTRDVLNWALSTRSVQSRIEWGGLLLIRILKTGRK